MIEYVGDDEWNVSDALGFVVGYVVFDATTGTYTAVADRDDQDVAGFDSVEDAADYVADV